MTVMQACGWSMAGTALIAACATAAAGPLHAALHGPPRWWTRRLLWAAALLPLLCPPILIGYGWSNLSVRLVHQPMLQQGLYASLLLLRLAPAAVLVLALSPRPAVSAEALHCHRLLGRRLSLALWLRGPARSRLAAAAVVALLAFSEFEIASLLGARAWTVWLFDAQAGGLALRESLRAAAAPVLIQAAVVAVAIAALWPRRGSEPQVADHADHPVPRRVSILAALWFALALLLTVVVPVAMVLPGAARGLGAMWSDLTIAQDLRHSLSLALTATLLALALVHLLRRLPRGLAAALCVPGLLGSLLLGLLLLATFQLPALRGAYDTPLPLLAALTLLLLPVGVVLAALLSTLGRGEPVHSAALLGREATRRPAARQLAHQLVGRAWWGLAIILFYVAYFDLSASALLAPSGMTPAVVRLYNLMHYGRVATLSAMVVLTLVLPLVLILVCMGLHRVWLHGRSLWWSGAAAAGGARSA